MLPSSAGCCERAIPWASASGAWPPSRECCSCSAESELDTHEVFYIASPDNHVNRPLADLIRHHHGDEIEIREPLPRPDASGLSIAKAERLLGYAPTRSWRDYLEEDGTAKPETLDRVERGDTGVQRGKAFG